MLGTKGVKKMTQQKKKQRKPNRFDLEILVCTLPPQLFLMLLPYKEEERYTLVAKIIDTWDKIRRKK